MVVTGYYQNAFQFPPLREGRPSSSAIAFSSWLFQFPPLREGRRDRSGVHGKAIQDFNSRPCARGDMLIFEDGKLLTPFQFPPLREGRRDPGILDSGRLMISIPAPARGATQASR